MIKITIPSTIIKAGGVESIPSTSGKGSLDSKGNYHDWLIRPSSAITITELNMSASILYTKEGKSNKQPTTIKVLNLNKDNINRIAVDDTVILRAGYDADGTEPPLVYAGQVTKVTTKKDGSDVTTTLLCSEGQVARKNLIVSRTPVRNETSLDVAKWFSAIAADNGIPRGNVFVPVEIPYPSGLPLSGKFFVLLDEFCSNNNLQHYITLGRLYIEPIDLTPVTTLITVYEDNVIGSIYPEDDSASSQLPAADNSGIKFSVFLDGNITTATVVDIAYGEYKGRYNVTSVQHKLDLEGSDWHTMVSCKRRTEKELANGIFGI